MEEKFHNNELRYEISASIDFGTTYSGVAYSYRGEEQNVYTVTKWPDGTNSSKIPTAILFDANQKFLSFGQGAIEKFVALADEDEEKTVYFFRCFKMKLYGEKAVTKTLDIQDATGKRMNAFKVFTEAISYMKKQLINSINERYPTMVLSEASVQWVLTVPAIWDDSSKQFMRQAAEKAGINGRNLAIALEPECASLHCFNTPKEKMVSTATINKEDSKYLVLDNGGGTVDITAHHVGVKGSVIELHKATGGAWGGTRVDERFIEYLYTLFTKANVEEVREGCPSEWEQLIQDFETLKKKVNKESLDSFVSIPVPNSFDMKNFRRLSEEARQGTIFKASRLRIPKKVIAAMISDVSSNIVNHTNNLLNLLNNNIDFIVLVGGFSNSPILVSDIKSLVTERRNIPVIVPEVAEEAVMKGAVLFGWNPRFVRVRKAKKTYGFCSDSNFISGYHPENRLYVNDFGEQKCRDCIDALVKVNQSIEINEKVKKKYSSPLKTSRTLSLTLYSTEKESVHYIDDIGISKVGELIVPMPLTSEHKRYINIDVIFGDTEIKVKAHDETSGEQVEATYDFL